MSPQDLLEAAMFMMTFNIKEIILLKTNHQKLTTEDEKLNTVNIKTIYPSEQLCILTMLSKPNVFTFVQNISVMI